MENTFLLWVDVLGFSKLCEDLDDKVSKIYDEVLAMRRDAQPTYSVTIFSDTIVVRNLGTLDYRSEMRFLIEFFRLIQDRLGSFGVFVRAIITFGRFHEERQDGVFLAYGPAVAFANKAEKLVNCIGLFLDPTCAQHNKFYPQVRLPEEQLKKCQSHVPPLFFVYTFASIERMKHSAYPAHVPLRLLKDTDQFYGLADEVDFLSRINASASDVSQHPTIRLKHDTFLSHYKQRYPELLNALLANDFDLSVINDEYDWKR